MTTWPATVCLGAFCGAATVLPDSLCEACWEYRKALLRKLPVAWNHAVGKLPPQARGAAPQVSGGAGPGSAAPLQLGVLDAMRATLLALETWASITRERCELDPLPDGTTVRAAWLLHACLETLREHDEVLGGQWFAPVYYNAVYKSHRRLVIVAGLAAAETERLLINCPQCSCMSIVSRSYGDHVVCLTCGTRWGQSAFTAVIQGYPDNRPVVS